MQRIAYFCISIGLGTEEISYLVMACSLITVSFQDGSMTMFVNEDVYKYYKNIF